MDALYFGMALIPVLLLLALKSTAALVNYHVTNTVVVVLIYGALLYQNLGVKLLLLWAVVLSLYLVYSFKTITICQRCRAIHRNGLFSKHCIKCGHLNDADDN